MTIDVRFFIFVFPCVFCVFVMFPRYNKFYRYPKRYTKSSVGKITQSRNFRASAANMTQNGLFSVNVRTPQTLQVQANSANSWAQLDVPALINSSAMHRQLSNVFDQYRIEKVTIRFKPLATTNTSSTTVMSFLNFFTVVDRSGLSAALTVDDLRTYASYKETVWSMNGDTPRPHVMNLGQADMVSRTEYFDSKKVAGFPTVAFGCDVGQAVSSTTAYSFTIEIDAQVRYRGVRLDTSNVSTRISSSF